MLSVPKYQPGSTIEVWFDSFAATGGSVTMTGFALGDIKVYKNGNTTPRASTSGFTLLDTDGTDIAGITGIHGFSIDLSNDSDVGFWASGSRYTIVVSTVTIDGQTISKVMGQFTIGEADSILDTTIQTVNNQSSFVLNSGPPDNKALNGCVAVIHSKISATQQCLGTVYNYTGSSRTLTLLADPTVFNINVGDNISILPDRSLKASVENRMADIGSTGGLVVSVYDDGAVWLDTVNGYAGTVPYVNGMADYPVNSLANALTLASALKLNRIRVAANSSLALTATLSNLQLIGKNWTLALGGQALTGTYVEGATLSGTGVASGAVPVFRDCIFGTQTLPPLIALNCGLSGTITAGSAGQYRFVDCHGAANSGAYSIFSCAGLATATKFTGWTGLLRINSQTDGSTITEVHGSGILLVATSCTDGFLYLSGTLALTNQSTIPIVVDTSRVAEDQNIAYVAGKVLGNDLDGSTIFDAGVWASGHDGAPLVRGVGFLVDQTADGGTTTSLIDTARTEPMVNHWRDSLLVITSGTMTGMKRVIRSYDPSTHTLYFSRPLPLAITSEAYELWPCSYDSSAIADGVWDESDSPHRTSGTMGKLLANASAGTGSGGSSGDPWSTVLPASYAASTAGKLLSDMHNRVGLFTGTGDNTILGFLKAIMRFDAPIPTDVGGTYDPVVCSLETNSAAHTAMFSNLAAIQSDTDNIQTRIPAALVGGRMDASVGAMAANVMTSAATDATYVTELQSGLATSAQATALAASIADVQSRLPAALVSGRMDASVGAMAANVITSAALDTTAGAEIADAVWDEALAGHLTAGTAGLALSTSSSGGVDPSILADAVWDEVLSDHLTAGTTGEQLSEAGGITPSSATMIADYVLRRHWQNAYDSSNGEAVSARSLLGMMARFVNRWEVVGTNLVVYLGDDTTVFLTIPMSTTADADQIIGMDPPA